MEKNPTTLKGWQKLYPDARKVTATANTFLFKKQILELAYGVGGSGKILQDRSSGTLSSAGGVKFNVNVIVSKMAATLTVVQP